MTCQKIQVVFAVCFFAVSVYSQQSPPTRSSASTLTGTITDIKTGLPLEGASLVLPDLKTGTHSGKDGSFKIRNLPSGRFLVEVSYVGYTSILESIDLSGNLQRNFSLAPSFIESEGVTVTGVSSATSTKRTPIPVSIIRKEDFMRGVSSNLVDALSKTPGVSQISTGPAISKPSIRGLGYNRVVVVNDGIRQEGQQWGDEHGIEIDELNVSKAEVLKGPASLMYGSDALAGVINIISIQPAPEGTVKGNVLGMYQGNNQQRGLHADIAGNTNGFTWGLNISRKAAADYRNKYDGYVFNSKFNERDGGGYVGFNKRWGFSHLYVTAFDQRLGLVDGERNQATGKFIKEVDDNGTVAEAIPDRGDFRSTNPFISRQRIRHFKLASDNSFNMKKGRLTLTLAYQRNQRQEFGNVLAPRENSLYFDLQTINYNVQYHIPGKNNWNWTIGTNGLQQNNHNKGLEALIPEYSLFDIGAFLFSQKKLERITLTGGIRMDNRNIDSRELKEGTAIKFPSFTKNFSNLSGSLGFSYEASKEVTLKLNIARGFRAPGLPELASNGAHEGTNRYEYGEEDLRSETTWQADGGLELATEHVSFSSNIFYNGISHFIYYRKLNSVSGGDSIIVDGNDQFFAFRFDQNNARLFGFESNLDIHPHPLDWLHIENSFSMVRGLLNKVQDGSKNLPFIPAAHLINELKAEFYKKGKQIHRAYLKMEFDNVFSQNHPFTGYGTETRSPGYTLLNAGLGADFGKEGKTLFSLYLGANNLTDVAYQNHLSRLKYAPVNPVTGRTGVFNMGRNFSIKLNIPISFEHQAKEEIAN